MKILCPTDFSKHSKIALEYAVHLANDLDAEIHLITTYTIPRRADTFVSFDEMIRKNNEEDLKALAAELQKLHKTDQKMVLNVYMGKASDIIMKYAREKDMDLIIMGTQGNNSLRTLLFGSTTRRVAERSEVPVLAVPQDIKYRMTTNKILLALDDDLLEKESTFSPLIKLLKKLNQKTDVIHISTKAELVPFDPFVSNYLGGYMGEVIVQKGQNAVEEIKQYVETEDVGMLVMIRRNKGFFERILTVGDTSEELAQTNVPLLILMD